MLCLESYLLTLINFLSKYLSIYYHGQHQLTTFFLNEYTGVSLDFFSILQQAAMHIRRKVSLLGGHFGMKLSEHMGG